MVRPALAILLPLAFWSPACNLLETQPTAQVPENPFGQGPVGQVSRQTSFTAAPLEVAARVDGMGRKLLAANQQLGLQPNQVLFRTIGAPQPEIFHQGTVEIDITEGLARKCATDGQLAAVLCQELGKLIADREARSSTQGRAPEGPPPMEVRVGSDRGGSFGPADQLYHAELAKFEKERRLQSSANPPDPQMLARTLLTKAGYPASDLDAVRPLLTEAGENRAFAKQLAAPAAGKP